MSVVRRIPGYLLRVLFWLAVCLASLHVFHDFSRAADSQRSLYGAHIVECRSVCEWTAIENIDELSDASPEARNIDILSACEPDKNDRDVLPTFHGGLTFEMSRQQGGQFAGLSDRSHRPLLRPPRATA